jgi:hypothetical protein
LVKAVLWTIHGHRRFHGNVQVLPRLVITAGREDSGKTSLAVALAHTSDVALVVVSPRPAIVYRSIEAHQVALFLDEADVWYPRNEDLRDLVNSGFNKDGALVARTEDVGALGKREHEVRLYSTFTPMAIVGINLEKVLARTVLSRALIIRMAPARVGEVVDDIFANPPAVKALREIASRIKRWAMDNEGRLATAKSDMPGVINRLRLVWGPLLAIADAAGGDWPGRARAALEVERGRIRDPNLGEALLLDALQVITEAGATGLHTKDLIERLLPLEMRTWSAFGRRRVAIRDIEVADLLAPYGLKPKQLKIGAINRRGYRLEDIQAAIERYVVVSDSEDTPEGRYPATDPQNPRDTAGSSGSGGGRYRDATSSDPLPENDFPGEVAATSKLDATDFIAENQCGSGVAPPRPPEHEHTAAGAVGAQPDGPGTVTITLVCKGCGQAFEHERKRGRPSMKCPGCRAGGSGGRLHPHQDADEQPATDQVHQPTLDEVVDQVSAGLRCSYCGMPFTDLDGEPVEIAGKLYHRDDACAGTVRRRLAAEARS